jgi:hypothetical protein
MDSGFRPNHSLRAGSRRRLDDPQLQHATSAISRVPASSRIRNQTNADAEPSAAFARNLQLTSRFDARVIAIIGLGHFTRLVGPDLGHLAGNAAFGFQRVIGVLEPQEITFSRFSGIPKYKLAIERTHHSVRIFGDDR